MQKNFQILHDDWTTPLEIEENGWVTPYGILWLGVRDMENFLRTIH